MSIRRKRKPDAYHLNIVREGKRSRDVRIEKVSIPFGSQVGNNVDSTRDLEDHLSDVSSSLLGCDFQEKAIDGSLNLEGDVAENGGQQTAHEKRKLKAANINISMCCRM